jgi:hypothetical protein
MPGILDLFNAQPNTAPNSNADPLMSLLQGTPQNATQPSLMQLLQGPQGLWPQSPFGAKQPNAPPYNDPGFNNLPFQSSPEQLARMLQLQSLMGVKQPPNSGEQLENPNFNNAPYQPTPEQIARMQQLTATFSQSRNLVDLRSVPQFYPQSGLPLQQMGWGVQGALQANPSWPRPAQPPMQRYGPGG